MPLRKLAHLTLLALALLTALAVFFVAQLRFNYNFNDFYPAGDPDLDYYLKYSQRFGNDNDYVLLGLEAPAGKTVFDARFLTKVDTLTRFIQARRHVTHVSSPTTLTNPVVEGLGQPDPERRVRLVAALLVLDHDALRIEITGDEPSPDWVMPLHHRTEGRDVAAPLVERLRLAAAQDIEVEDVATHDVAERVEDRAKGARHGGRELRGVEASTRVQHANRGPDVVAEGVAEDRRRHCLHASGPVSSATRLGR